MTLNSVEDNLLEAHCFLKNIGEWLSEFARNHNSLVKHADCVQTELKLAKSKLDGLENRF